MVLSQFYVLFCVIIFASLRLQAGVTVVQSEQYFLKAPSNIVVVAGKSVFMNCSSKLHDPPLTWYLEQQKLSVGSQITDTTHRDIINPAAGEYSLLIRSVRTADAGRYSCVTNDGDEGRITAELIVIESDPVCTTVSSRDDYLVTELEFVHLDCTINYRGNWAPTMSWYFTDVTGTEHDVTYVAPVVNSTSVRSSVSVNMTVEHNGGRFKCVTYFNESSKPPSTTANNVPQYRHEWVSESFSVQYFARPRNITQATALSQFSTQLDGNLLKCVADGNPSPTYRWINISTNSSIQDGAVIDVCKQTFSRPEELDCEATNTVSGVTKSLRLNVQLNATAWNEVIQQCSSSYTIVVVLVCSIICLLPVLVSILFVARKNGFVCVSKQKPDIVASNNANQREGIELHTYSDVSEIGTNINENHGSVASVANIREVEAAYSDVFELDRNNINGSVASVANLRDVDVENDDCFYADVRVVRNPASPPRPPRQIRDNQAVNYAAIDHRIGLQFEPRQQ